MARFKRPCSLCGEPTKSTTCEDCTTARARMVPRDKPHAKKLSPKERGYDSRWRRLSERARKLQPFCSDCGSEKELQADHSPETWQRFNAGLPLRITDVEVVCMRCNLKRGAARGESLESNRYRFPVENG